MIAGRPLKLPLLPPAAAVAGGMAVAAIASVAGNTEQTAPPTFHSRAIFHSAFVSGRSEWVDEQN